MREKDGYLLLTAEIIKSICHTIKDAREELKRIEPTKYYKRMALERKIRLHLEWLDHWCRVYDIEPEYILNKYIKEGSKR